MRSQLLGTCHPRRRGSLVLLAFALLALGAGCRPGVSATVERREGVGADETASAADGGIRFSNVAVQRGVRHEWPQQPRPMRASEAFGCGCALVDYDNDGWLDVLLVSDPHPRLFRNQGQGRFKEATAEAGLDSLNADWTGCAWGDCDGDGFVDLLLTGLHVLALFKNQDGKSFVETTALAGLDPSNRGHWGSSAGFMDLDGDEHLDLVILNYVVFGPAEQQYCQLAAGVWSGCPPSKYRPEFGEIWRNDGQGRFELVPAEQAMEQTHGKGLVLAFSDLNRDGLQDFYIGNDGMDAELMQNLGGMKFKNVGYESGVALNNFVAMAAMGADWADYDRDSLEDLTVTGFADEEYALFRNCGNFIFESVSARTGITVATFKPLGFGAKWIDMDNDAWPDLSYANGHVYDTATQLNASMTFRQPLILMRNEKGSRFVDIVPSLGGDLATPILGRGTATGDFDNDGRVDLLVVDFEGPALLLRNESQTKNHWIGIDLRSPGPNRFAYGARLTAKAGGETWIATVSPASSYLSSSSLRIHWGLGAVEKLDSLTIHWTSGQKQVLDDLESDRILTIVEGEGIVKTVVPQPARSQPAQSAQSQPD